MGEKGEKIFVVAADCTGHGVPGAFMSMLGISFLDEIINKSETSDTNLILNSLRNYVITSLKQSGKSMEESTKDGMDLAMIAYDRKRKKIQFSGAYNPLYCVRKLNRKEKELINKGDELDLPRGAMNNNTHILYQVKGDPMPIGISEKSFEFSAKELDSEGYSLYMFTDGYVDQFGGPSGKKFMSKNFKKLILEMQKFPIGKQGMEMERILKEWMGNISQIDDILVIGLQMN
jgi:serine phosphatase RsbU (regulator of sigma subunit)